MPVCAEMISSWVWKVLCIAMVHMSPGAVACAALAAGVFLTSILQASHWARVLAPARHYFLIYITTSDLAPGFNAVCCPGP